MSALIDQINARCVEVGDCWEWQGAMQACGSTPVVRINQKTIGVRRLLLQHLGVNVRGKVCTYKCGNPLCVNPEHLEAIGRKKLSRRLVKETNYTAGVLRKAKLADKARARGKLTAEIAQEIKQAEGTQREIAARYGVSQATVSAIKRGETWKDYANPFAQLLGGKHD
jgi:predicted XRE-type DNA-binding protein